MSPNFDLSQKSYQAVCVLLIGAALLYGFSGAFETFGFHSKVTQKGFDVAAKSIAILCIAYMAFYTQFLDKKSQS